MTSGTPDDTAEATAPGWHRDGPDFTWTSRNGFTITVLLAVLSWAVTFPLFGFVACLWSDIISTAIGTPRAPSVGDGALAVAVLVLAVAAHESGHVLGYALTGQRWTGVGVRAFGAYVRTEPAPSPGRQLLISLLGPAFEVAFGVVVLQLAHGWSPVAVMAAMLIANGVFNGVSPLPRRTDGGEGVQGPRSADRRDRQGSSVRP